MTIETALADAFAALGNILSLGHLGYLMLGVLFGLVVGVLPGLGGVAGLSLVLPFTFGMEPTYALAMMVGLIAPTTTSDTFPAVLMGIPGTTASQATILDGFPLARRGEAARALSAAFIASLIGGVFGAVVLTFAVFFAAPLILAMGFGEQMMLMVLAISMVGMLTGPSALKGLAACGLGLMLGSVGVAPATSETRLAFGTLYLSDGLSIIIIGLGLFAIPEIVELLRRSNTISETGSLGRGWLTGVRDTLRNWWLVLRCSSIGCLIGAIPGLGGSVVDWVAYGHTVQTSRNKEQFGNGDIRGVIGPESANNAKEGGSLIPTLLFGIPGSGAMALLLSGFILIGIEPGIGMIRRELDLTFTIIWSLALANVLGAGLCFLCARPVARLTIVPYGLIGPVMLVVIFFAAFQASRSWWDLVALLAIGIFGIYMKRFGWPRAALLIGVVLSRGLETSVYQAVQIYGLRFFERPIVLVLCLLVALSIAVAIFVRVPAPGALRAAELAIRRKAPQVVFTLILVGLSVLVLADAFQRSYLGRLFPLVVAGTTLAMLGLVLVRQVFATRPTPVFADGEIGAESTHGNGHYLAWMLGALGLALAIGFPLAAAVFVLAFTTVKVGWKPVRNIGLALACVLVLSLLARFLSLRYPGGLLQRVADLPWWLGASL